MINLTHLRKDCPILINCRSISVSLNLKERNVNNNRIWRNLFEAANLLMEKNLLCNIFLKEEDNYILFKIKSFNFDRLKL